MILSAHQPAYLPWLGLFDKIAKSDVFVQFDMVQFEKDSYINRNKIRTKTGTQWLTVPIQSVGHMSHTIYDTKIDNSRDWKKKHWESIKQNYSKAPYFEKYAHLLEWTYQKDWDYIADLNICMLKCFTRLLGINTEIRLASQFKFKGKKSDLILDMCKQLGADKFIFGAEGQKYADVDKFKKEGIEIEFQDYKPTLSIIDSLFNKGEKTNELFKCNNPGVGIVCIPTKEISGTV